MSALAHIDNLKERQEKLEQQIHDAYLHHLPVTELKKQRLRIKDQIFALTS